MKVNRPDSNENSDVIVCPTVYFSNISKRGQKLLLTARFINRMPVTPYSFSSTKGLFSPQGLLQVVYKVVYIFNAHTEAYE
jgi:hypothetical protein